MKKILSSAVIILSVSLLTACGQKTGECTGCGKTAPLYKVSMTFNGEVTSDILCKECADKSVEFIKEMSGALKTDVPYTVEEYKGK